jgi:3-dehydroquinate synthase
MQPQSKLVVEHSAGECPIYIDSGWLPGIADAIGRSTPRCAVITDANVEKLYAAEFFQSLNQQSSQCVLLTIAPGESSKSLDTAIDLYQQLLSAGIDRQSTIVALGGGVVGDLAGFVAATWQRGIRLIQVPTSLLAQVDSSVGGKTGVNLPSAKNVVGAFWQPQEVYIDTKLAGTLPDVEYTSGLAEVVKYGAILDDHLFASLESRVEQLNRRDPQVLVDIVLRCCQLKASVVKRDERETTGQRAILNYGHTFGHAIESVFGYGKYPHGHAVSIGMMAAARLAQAMGRVDEDFVERQCNLLTALQIPTRFPAERHAEVIEVMKHDKKAIDGHPRFVLPRGMGHGELVEGVSPDKIADAMQRSAGGSK